MLGPEAPLVKPAGPALAYGALTPAYWPYSCGQLVSTQKSQLFPSKGSGLASAPLRKRLGLLS